ncbi:MAG: outer membrane protein assembly factor BamD [Candidatus Eisenbacteria bacterium]|uniref:Outer membrane protein assembly factor BamD n=1 Tax=Eiseniibacteriota bacterium TaxID=2212470 RepID=A0A948WBD0_UNCEI|nr:outer membrane protein assembly factor BamD [Candidatus Eisenbacteria bacterium]MBU1950133.1 outer membrane protein assembly factor BamD [Candidatus Eisenbacteria bacterium]MBU2689843.1 outer membrane protein assembly factor BamD [Candidatus Eisenbacteria bacterium]
MPIKINIGSRLAGGLALLFAVSLLISGCGGSHGGKTESHLPVLDELIRARRDYDKGHYSDAVLSLAQFTDRHPGSRFMDEALFKLGKSHQYIAEYLLATDSFRRILDDYPQSEWLEEATYELGRSAYLGSKGPDYDQEATYDAISTFRLYLRQYPEGNFVKDVEELLFICEDRLVRKAYISGDTYLKVHRMEPARFYFDKGIAIRSDVPAAADCLLGLARSYKIEKKPIKALEAFERLQIWLEGEGANLLEAEKHDRLLESIANEMNSLTVGEEIFPPDSMTE